MISIPKFLTTTIVSLLAIMFFSIAIKPYLANAQTSTTIAAPPAISSPSISAAPVAAAKEAESPNWLEKILEAIKNSGGIVAGFLILFEVVVRLFPSKSPLSILVPVKYFIDGAEKILFWLSNSVLLPMINIANKSDQKLEPEKKV